jgi:hypothetical protein
MRSPLNSPLEVGVRVLMILTEAYPQRLDVDRLVLLDHGVLHSGDLGGPESLHPPLPVRAGELGIKRTAIEEGIQVMVRAKLVEMRAGDRGIEFVASDNAYAFVSVLASTYAVILHERIEWIFGHFSDLSEDALRVEMRSILSSWAEEFGPANALSEGTV